MEYTSDQLAVSNFIKVSKAFAILLFGIGLAALAGWISNTAKFPIINIGYSTIKVNSAIICMAAGISLFCLHHYKFNKFYKGVLLAALSIIFIISTLTLLQYQLNVNFGIDELFFKDKARPTLGIYGGRVAPAACIACFIFITCIALAHIGWHYIVQTVLILLGLVAYSRILADTLGLFFINTGSFYINMELNTAANVLLASIAFISTFPEKGYNRILTSKYLGSSMTRKVIPMAFFLSTFFLWLRVEALRMGILAPDEAMVFSVTVFTLIIIIVFFTYGFRINYIDKQRSNRDEELLEAQSKLTAIINNSFTMVCTIDDQHRFTMFNELIKETYFNIFGINPHEGNSFLVPTLADAIKNRWEQLFKRAFNGETFTVELAEIIQNQPMAIQLFLSPIRSSEGLISEISIVGIDITQKKQIERELIVAKEKAEEASHAKSRFLSVMSHEIRTPLNAVIGMTNLLMKDNLTPSQQQKLNTMKFSGNHLLNLVNDILDLNKIESGMMELEHIPSSFRRLTNSLIQTFQFKAQEKGLLLQATIHPLVPENVIADPTRLMQILNNLVNNAIKFTDSGSVLVDITCDAITENKALIHIEVKDTGIGIAPDKLESIFERFTQADSDTTRKYGGTGLGLPIAKKLLHMFGSDLHVSSTLGIGTCFYFDIELATMEDCYDITHDTNSNDTIIQDLRQARILLVDDNAINRMVAEELLLGWNCTVEKAENGLEAVAKIQAEEFDLILMDLQMPLMDGFEAATIIRHMPDLQKANLPIIALTAAALLEVKEKIKQHGMNEFISKPFDPDELYKKIANQLGIGLQKQINPTINKSIQEENSQLQELITLDSLVKITKGNKDLLNEFVAKIEAALDSFRAEYNKYIQTHSLDDMRRLTHAHRPTFELLKADQLLVLIEKTKEYLSTEPKNEAKNVLFKSSLNVMIEAMHRQIRIKSASMPTLSN